SPAPLIDWTNPNAPKTITSVTTNASVAEIKVPTQNELQAQFGVQHSGVVGALPTVKLALGVVDSVGRPVEYGWRVDGGMWRNWTQDPNPVVSDPAFVLQGHHKIEVRSRILNAWSTESAPVALDVLIDSIPPELHPVRDDVDRNKFDFGGFDIVTDTSKLL